MSSPKNNRRPGGRTDGVGGKSREGKKLLIVTPFVTSAPRVTNILGFVTNQSTPNTPIPFINASVAYPTSNTIPRLITKFPSMSLLFTSLSTIETDVISQAITTQLSSNPL